MDWRDSNIVLGEQMNTRGYDSSRLLASHKGVGILRPDGDTQAGADVLALTVRTYYMPNEDWQTICQRGRELRQAAGTLTGHAAGQVVALAADHAAAVKAIGAGPAGGRPAWSPDGLPEPLAAVVAYLGEDLDEDGREFVPTAELVEVLDVEPTTFARQMGELGCRPDRHRIPGEDGETRRIRGYFTADIRAAVTRAERSPGTEPGERTDRE
jgi:S-DNA-T family DNA segregation ATPase FtsK/SpoIIIE